MNFLAPYAFWFAAALPIVVLFYLLKRKRVAKVVSSTVLWQRFLAETQANAPFQKLRHNWLLILQLLMLACAILALSRPYFASKTREGVLRVMILDASASMQSTDESPTRFEKARSEALKLVNSLADSDQLVVISSSGRTEVKQSATSNKGELRRALENCAVTDSPSRLGEALTLAETLTRDRLGAEVHLFSDGAAGDLTEFENKSPNLVFHKVGIKNENLAITTLDIKSNPENPAQRAIYTSVLNFSSNRVSKPIELLFNNQLIQSKPLEILPGQTAPLVFVVPQTEDGVFTVKIEAEDQFPVDNAASMISRVPQDTKILLITGGNSFLQKVLKTVPNAVVTLSETVPANSGEFDVVVLDGIVPSSWPDQNVLAIRVADTNLFSGWKKIEQPPIVDWKGTHPILRYVNFDNVLIREGMQVEKPDWADSLLDSPSAPLILAGQVGENRIVWLAFDVADSNWPLRFSFPIFMANAVDWLNPQSEKNRSMLVKSGEAFRARVEPELKEATIIRPDGISEKISIEPARRQLVYGNTFRSGVYSVTAGTNQSRFVVNLLSQAESNITPVDKLKFGKYAFSEATEVKRANMEIWRWIALVALLFLMGEWWYYHRRTA